MTASTNQTSVQCRLGGSDNKVVVVVLLMKHCYYQSVRSDLTMVGNGYREISPIFRPTMPRVVPDQREKFENDELFRKLSRESEVSESFSCFHVPELHPKFRPSSTFPKCFDILTAGLCRNAISFQTSHSFYRLDILDTEIVHTKRDK